MSLYHVISYHVIGPPPPGLELREPPLVQAVKELSQRARGPKVTIRYVIII